MLQNFQILPETSYIQQPSHQLLTSLQDDNQQNINRIFYEQKEMHVDSNQIMTKMSYFSRSFFGWVKGMQKIGTQTPLQQSDVLKLRDSESSSYNHEQFETERNQARYQKTMTTIWMTFQGQIFLLWVFIFLSSVYNLLSPLAISILMNFVEEKTTSGIIMAIFFMIIQFGIQGWIKSNLIFEDSVLQARIQGAIQTQLYQKALSISILRNYYYKIGDILNLLQVDVMQANFFWRYIFSLMITPLLIIITAIISAILVGSEFTWVELLTSSLQLIANLIFGYIFSALQRRFMNAKDTRIRNLEEMLRGVKQIKYNQMENFFQQRLEQCRKDEIRLLVGLKILTTVINSFTIIFPIFNLMLSHYLIGINDIKKLLQVNSSFMSFSQCLSELPAVLSGVITAYQSFRRIDQFIKQEDHYNIKFLLNKSQENQNSLELSRSSYSYQQKHNQNLFSLNNIEFSINDGDLVAFVGDTGSGKTSLVHCLLGELSCIDHFSLGKVLKIQGKLSYASQNPWVVAGTIKYNIILDQEYNDKRYINVLKFSALQEALNHLPDRDMTYAGGDSLSHGLKKLVNLARAIYQRDSNIFLFDDILTGLDKKSRNIIVQECLGKYLQGKTRIVFANRLNNLEEFDKIYIMNGGKLVFGGTYDECQDYYRQNQQISPSIEENGDEEEVGGEDPKKENSIDRVQDNQLEEDKNSGPIKLKLFKYFITLSGGLSLIFVLTFVLAQSFLMQLSVKQLKAGDGLGVGETLTTYYYSLLAFSLFLFLKSIIIVLISRRMSIKIHNNIILRIMKGSCKQFFNVVSIGRIINRMSLDIYIVDSKLPQSAENLLTSCFNMFAFFAFYLMIGDFILYLILIIFFIFCFFVGIGYLKCMAEISRLSAITITPIISFFDESVKGSLFVKNCLNESFNLIKLQNIIDLNLTNKLAYSGFQCLFIQRITIIQIIVLIIMVVRSFILEEESYILRASINISNLMITLVFSFTDYYINMINFERCYNFSEEIIIEEENPLKIHQENSDNDLIKLQNSEFGFNQEGVLSEINLNVQKNVKLGIYGANGSGKTIFTYGLTRIIDQSKGSIWIKGHNYQDINLTSLRSHFSVIPQDPFVFQGSLQDNLDPSGCISDNALLQMSQQLGLFDRTSFKTLYSQITENGNNISQGEKQMVSIGRALLRNSDIFIIDEFSTNIDEQLEKNVNLYLNKFLIEKTIIKISHSINNILDCDQIVMVQNGRMKEQSSQNVRKLLEKQQITIN